MSSATHAHGRLNRAHGDHDVRSSRDELSCLKETIQGGLHEASDSGKRVARSASVAARDTYDTIRESAAAYRDRAAKFVNERPMTSIALAAVAGAALMGVFVLWRRRS